MFYDFFPFYEFIVFLASSVNFEAILRHYLSRNASTPLIPVVMLRPCLELVSFPRLRSSYTMISLMAAIMGPRFEESKAFVTLLLRVVFKDSK